MRYRFVHRQLSRNRSARIFDDATVNLLPVEGKYTHVRLAARRVDHDHRHLVVRYVKLRTTMDALPLAVAQSHHARFVRSRKRRAG